MGASVEAETTKNVEAEHGYTQQLESLSKPTNDKGGGGVEMGFDPYFPFGSANLGCF